MPPQRSNDTRTFDPQALTLVFRGSLGIAALGGLFALLTASNAVLLDGARALVDGVFAQLRRRLDRQFQNPEGDAISLSQDTLELMLNVVQSAIELAVLALAAALALVTIASGGRPIDSGIALGYGAIVAIVGTNWAARLGKIAEKTGLSVVDREAKRWFNRGMTGLLFAIAFSAAFLTGDTLLEPLRYLDPILVLLMVAVSVSPLWKWLRHNWTQLLGHHVEGLLEKKVHRILDRPLRLIPHQDVRLKIEQLGRDVYVDLDFLVSPENQFTDELHDLDRIRMLLYERLHVGIPNLVLNVSFTGDRVWMERAIANTDRASSETPS
ncbi:cation transporter [Baaleninema simplex]|uniref:cation transporter n=1 Tax=Baaleninema simplex TaxID=2862350 RepID=UPI000345392F|nr:cation transporter [Baaleninema simplex]